MNKRIISILLPLILSAPSLAAAPDVLSEAKAKYSAFENSIQDMTLVIASEMAGTNAASDVKLYRKGPKSRTEVTMALPGTPAGVPSMKTILIDDGAQVWMISPFTGKTVLPRGEAQDPSSSAYGWDLLKDGATVAGEEVVDGRKTWIVQSLSSSAAFSKMWLDAKSFALVKAEKDTPEGKMLLENSNFEKVGDWELPYLTRVSVNGRPTVTSKIQSVALNQGLADDLFDADKVEAPGMDMGGLRT